MEKRRKVILGLGGIVFVAAVAVCIVWNARPWKLGEIIGVPAEQVSVMVMELGEDVQVSRPEAASLEELYDLSFRHAFLGGTARGDDTYTYVITLLWDDGRRSATLKGETLWVGERCYTPTDGEAARARLAEWLDQAAEAE